MTKIILDKVFAPIVQPRRNIRCIAFTATAALVGAMLAAGIPVKRHPIEPWKYVSPERSLTTEKLWELVQDSRFKFLGIITFLVSPTGSNQTFNVPLNWNSALNKVETIAGAGSGGASQGANGTVSGAASGGGAGAYSAVLNLVFVPGSTATYQIGAGGASVSSAVFGTSAVNGNPGGDSWFNGTTLAGSSVGAKAGGAGLASNGGGAFNGGAGGLASGGVGTTKHNGSGGGLIPSTSGGFYAASGGGGAAGPNGDGGAVSTPGLNSTSAGGSADNGTVSGGAAGGVTGSNGNSGTEFDGSHGCGSGGGAGLSTSATAATGGSGANYGGAGAGAAGDQLGSGVSGAGAQGIIVVTNFPREFNRGYIIG
jgi:hypothetical protein